MKSIIMFLLEIRYGLALRQAWLGNCAGMDFQEWVISYLSFRPTPHAADLPRACAAGNHYTNDVGRGRDFSFCPDCGKPLM